MGEREGSVIFLTIAKGLITVESGSKRGRNTQGSSPVPRTGFLGKPLVGKRRGETNFV